MQQLQLGRIRVTREPERITLGLSQRSQWIALVVSALGLLACGGAVVRIFSQGEQRIFLSLTFPGLFVYPLSSLFAYFLYATLWNWGKTLVMDRTADMVLDGKRRVCRLSEVTAVGAGARKVRLWAGDRSYPVALLFDWEVEQFAQVIAEFMGMGYRKATLQGREWTRSPDADPFARLPRGWRVEPQPDGTQRITVPSGIRSVSGISLALPVLIFGYLVKQGLFSGGISTVLSGDFPWLLQGVFLGILGVLGLSVLWFFFGREEWRAGHNRLEVQKRLFFYRRSCQYRDGKLAVRSTTTDMGPGRQADASTPAWALVVSRTLRFHNNDVVVSRTLRSHNNRNYLLVIGELLSSLTGWPLDQV